jgi:hypothetical protein
MPATCALPLVRWTARTLSALILLFWGFFLLSHLSGIAGAGSRPLALADYAILGSLCVALAGLAAAWRFEAVGGAVTLSAIAVCAAFNWRVLEFPGTLIPLAAGLFLFAAWLAPSDPKLAAASR